MKSNPLTFVPRNPRHQVNEEVPFQVRIEREHEPSNPLNGQLLDFSRQGFRIQTADLLSMDERVTLCVDLADVQQFFRLKGAVRWLNREGETLIAGFHFDEQAPLELLGELVLHGVLENATSS